MIARIPRSCGVGMIFHGLLLIIVGLQLLAVRVS